MRKILKGLLLFSVLMLVLVAGALYYALRNANQLIAAFRPQIEMAASEVLGSPVKLGNLDVSIFPDAAIRIDEIKVGDEKGDSKPLSLKNLNLDIELRPLFSKKLEITELSLDNPQITFLKDSSGITVAGLKTSSSTAGGSEKQKPTAGEDKQPSKSGDHGEGLTINLRKLQIKDGLITLKDLEQKKDIAISDLQVSAGLDSQPTAAIIDKLSI
jgi:uncharacterized protein involved in outer membrane biogenesis